MPRDHAVAAAEGVVRSPRLTLRPWRAEDAEAALAVYGADDVARWLSPAMDRVPDANAMRALIERWQGEDLELPQGRWAVTVTETGEVVGGVAVLPLPPHGEDLVVAWQLAPHAWGNGYAADDLTGLGDGHGPPALRQLEVLSVPALDERTHGVRVRHPVHRRRQPARDVVGAVHRECRLRVLDPPRSQGQPGRADHALGRRDRVVTPHGAPRCCRPCRGRTRRGP